MDQAQGIFRQTPTRADRIDNVVWGQWEKGRNDGGVGRNGRLRRAVVGKGSFKEGTIGTYCQQGKEQTVARRIHQLTPRVRRANRQMWAAPGLRMR